MIVAAADPGLVRWAAEQVVRQHAAEPTQDHAGREDRDQWRYPDSAAGRCAQCDGGDPDCRMLVWARAELAAMAPDVG